MFFLEGFLWDCIFDTVIMEKIKSKGADLMKRIKLWIWKCFHKKEAFCKHFCGTCEYYEYCKYLIEKD